MKLHVASTLDELEMMLTSFGSDVLFRGQNSHYGEPGEPSVGTSFDRKGCIPSEMLKWCRYSQNVLDAFIQGHRGDFAYQQALLQHYGWRSFYVDCTSNPAVAAWFASHSYSEEPKLEISEDCDERPVWLKKRMARYDFTEGQGHLYVLDKQAVAEVGLVDLATLTVDGFRPRTVAQSAWLIGPLRNKPIPQNCYIAQISVPRSVLRDYAASQGLMDTSTLFPPASEDPILKALLGLPWDEIKIEDSIKDLPAFRRALDLPEYHPSYLKIAPASTAFYRGAKILDTQDSIDGSAEGGILVNIPDLALYGSADRNTPLRFPHIDKLIDEHGTVAFEADTLIQHAQLGDLTLYQKGVGVLRREPDLFEVCELTVSHPGLEMTGAGFTAGWFYRRQANGLWTREENKLECSCGSEIVHGRHLSVLHIAEEYLMDPEPFSL
ncbi:TPA: FRG domain-containing protein [Pseudomonas aeruginosa]